MKLSMKIAAMLCTTVSSMLMAQQSAFANDVGVREIAAPSKERGSDVAVTVWYPAESGGKAVTLGESVFFVGTPAMLDAPSQIENSPWYCFPMALVWQETHKP